MLKPSHKYWLRFRRDVAMGISSLVRNTFELHRMRMEDMSRANKLEARIVSLEAKLKEHEEKEGRQQHGKHFTAGA